jgi:hypothetical protein
MTPIIMNFLCGGIAATALWSLSYPFDGTVHPPIQSPGWVEIHSAGHNQRPSRCSDQEPDGHAARRPRQTLQVSQGVRYQDLPERRVPFPSPFLRRSHHVLTVFSAGGSDSGAVSRRACSGRSPPTAPHSWPSSSSTNTSKSPPPPPHPPCCSSSLNIFLLINFDFSSLCVADDLS